MGREAAITYEKVAAAADTCKLAGGKPTSRGIRELLVSGQPTHLFSEFKTG